MKKPVSIRRNLALHFSIIIFMQSLIVAVLIWQVLLPQMRINIGIHHQTLARAISGEVAAQMFSGEHQINALAIFIDSGEDLSESQWIKLLDSQCGDGELFETIYIANYQDETISSIGLVRARRDKREDLIGLNLSGRGFLRKAKKLGKPFWSEPFLSTTSGQMVVAVTIPLSNRALIGEITVERLTDITQGLPAESDLITMILDRRGGIIADSRGIIDTQNYKKELFAETKGDRHGVSSSTSFQLKGKTFIGSVVDIDPLGWTVLVAQPYQNAYQPVRYTFLTILLGLAIAIVLALAFTWFQVTKLKKVADNYSEYAQAIAQGIYNRQQPPAKIKEFVELSDALQQMVKMISLRERQVVENENNLKITLNSIGDAVIATDVEGRVQRMNPLAERLTGWMFADAQGMNLSEVFHIVNAHSRVRMPNPVEKVLAEEVIVGLANHTVLISKSGDEYQIADSAAPIRDTDGCTVGVVMVFRDVTENYLQDQKIRESEKLLKNLTANVPGVVFQLLVKPDYSYSTEFVSQKKSGIFGLDVPPEDFFAEFFSRIPADEKQPMLDSLMDAIKNAKKFYWEGRYKRPSGETIWFSESAIPYIEGDNIIFCGMLMDITERKQWESTLQNSERRFKELFNEAPVVYVITESRIQEPYIKDVNKAFVDMLGYSRSEVLDTPLAQYYTEDSQKELIEKGGFQRALRGEFLNEERSFITRDGRTVHTLLHALPEYDANGKVLGTRAMFLDITSRKIAQQETKRLETVLRQTQKMEAIGTLAGGIAHDFNNILSAVIGYSELALTEVEKDNRLYRYLEQILSAGMRAKDLVHQILVFSRQEEHEVKPLQIEPLVKEALKLMRSSLPATIEIHQQIDSDLDSVLADPTQIHRIIVNLCTNAAQAMEENGGQLTITLSQATLSQQDIRLHPDLSPGKYLKLSVQDTGQGIPQEIAEKIFEPYFTTKEKGKGTGLGLSVVHGIVANYGGAIYVYSERGYGTKFNVYLPAIKQHRLSIKPEEVKLPTGSEHVLLVDDEPMLLEMGQLLLESLGYKVTVCDSGLAAVEIINRSPSDIDLVISDVTMPKMTGDQLAQKILQMRKDLPIILCTGHSSKVTDELVSKIGVKALAMKPLTKEVIALLVRKVLDEALQSND